MLLRSILILFFAAQLSGVQSANCTFQLSGTVFRIYSCTLINQNIQTEAEMQEIHGDHVPGFTDANVTALLQQRSTVAVFPSLIIDRFPNLSSVTLSNAGMTNFGKPITNCTRLDFVSLNGGGITNIPARIFENCGNLRHLTFAFQPINSIDLDAFIGLSSLTSIFISGANLEIFNPQVLTSSPQLTHLDLINCRISSFSTQFPRLPNLMQLQLSNNNLTSWNPMNLGVTSPLRALFLDRNEITALAANAFANLPQLIDLTVGDELTALPIFENVGNLQRLDIERCPLTHVSAASFQNMGSLRILVLASNQIATIDFTPRNPPVLQGLTALYLGHNRIADIQDFAFGTLTALTWLDLQNNQITRLNESSIRPVIAGLQTLDLRSNNVREIERGLFDGITFLSIQMSGCFNGSVILQRNLQSTSQAFLNNCVSFGVNLKANLFVIFLLLGIAVWGRK